MPESIDVDYERVRRAADELRQLNEQLVLTSLRAQQLADDAERERREKLALLESTGEGIVGVDLAGRCTFVNRAAAELFGFPPAEMLGKNVHGLVHHSHRDGAPYSRDDCPLLRACRDAQGVRMFAEALWRRDGTTFAAECASSPLAQGGRITGAVMTFVDVTERRRAEEVQRFLAEVGKQLANSLDIEATLQEVLRLAVPTLADCCLVDVVEDEGRVHLAGLTHVDPAKETLIREARRRYPPLEGAPNATRRVMVTGRPLFYPEIPDAGLSAFARDPEHLELLRALGLGSVMGVPLRARGKTLGTLVLMSGVAESGRRYREADLQLAEELARRAALALDNAQLYEAEQRARQAAERAAARAASLQDITAALSQAATPAEVADAVIQRALPGVGAAAGSIALLTDTGALEPLRAVGYPEHVLASSWRLPLDASTPMVEAVRSGEAVWPEAVRARQLTGFGAAAALPLLVGGRAVGALECRFADERVLGEEDRAFLMALSAQCGQALERARLYEVERRAHAEAEAERQRVQFLAEASTVLASSLDAGATLQNLARQVVPFLADWCTVDIVEESGTIRRVAVAHRDPAKEELARTVQPRDLDGQTGFFRLLPSGHAQLLPDIRAELLAAAANNPQKLRLVRELAPRSYIGVPLVARGRTLGMVHLVTAQSERCYARADLVLAEELARRVSQAVDNAQLYRTSQQAVRVRDEFLASASHELRTPLAHIKGFVSTLRQTDVEWDEATQRDFLGEVEREADRLARLIGDLLDISRMESGGLNRPACAPARLSALVAGGLDRLGDVVDRRRLRVEVPADLPRVDVDSSQLERVIVNLIENAVKFAPPATPVRIAGALVADTVQLRVEDEGPGIPEEYLQRVFERFFRVRSDSAPVAGTGLGLAICRRIVQAHGGRIWAENRPSRGARLVVALPPAADAWAAPMLRRSP